MQADSVKKRRLAPWLLWFGALFALYALTYHGFTGSVIDETMPLAVSAQLLDAHTAQINPLYPALRDWGALDSNLFTPIYSKYAIGQSLLMLPTYALGSLIPNQSLTHASNGWPFLPAVPVLLTYVLGSLITVLTAFGIVKTAQVLGYSMRTGAWIALLYAVTTLAWPYAKTLYNEPSTACAIIGTVYFSIRYRQSGRWSAGLLAGGCLGGAILFRTTSVLFVPLLMIYLWPTEWRNLLKLIRIWLWLAPGIAFGILITLGYDLYRFGSLFETGYEPGFGRAPWEALLGYLVSPSRSIFLFAPILLLAIPGALIMGRRLGRETLYLIALALIPVGLYATWWAWDGGGSLGPRFLLPSIPVAILLIAPVIDRPGWRSALIVFGVIGFGIQILSNLATPADVFGGLLSQSGVTYSTINWQWHDSLIANLWSTYTQRRIDSVIMRLLPIHNPIILALVFTLICASLISVMIFANRKMD